MSHHLDDDELASPRDKSVADIGTIEIRLTFVRLGGTVEFAGICVVSLTSVHGFIKFTPGYEAEERGPVHEGAKKAGVHHTVFVPHVLLYLVEPHFMRLSFGKPQKMTVKSRGVTTAPLNPDEPGPHVRFIFRYRSLGLFCNRVTNESYSSCIRDAPSK